MINQGATLLVLILSFAHSHAKFFVNWLIAPANSEKGKKDKKRGLIVHVRVCLAAIWGKLPQLITCFHALKLTVCFCNEKREN